MTGKMDSSRTIDLVSSGWRTYLTLSVEVITANTLYFSSTLENRGEHELTLKIGSYKKEVMTSRIHDVDNLSDWAS